ncbi:MAG: hypothetical protein RIC55_20280 [Pirellulaceae bacterium]
MSLFGLTSIAPAVAAVAGQAADRLADGFSFAEAFLRPEDASPQQDATPKVDPTAEAAASDFQAGLDEFRKQLQDRLAAGGVDLSQPITLQTDSFGGIEVAGDHPDRALIEQILADDAALTAAFQQLSSEHATVATGDAKSLEKGNDSAYDRVLKDIRRRDFRVTFQGEQASVND